MSAEARRTPLYDPYRLRGAGNSLEDGAERMNAEEHCERLASEPDVTVTQTNSQQLCSPPHKPELTNISVEGDYQYLSLWPSC